MARDSSDGTSMIPQPDYVSKAVIRRGPTSLFAQMRLAENDEDVRTFYDILNDVASLCDKHYPPDLRKMAPEARQSMLDEITEMAIDKHPILRQYEEHWPVPAMVDAHRAVRQQRVAKDEITYTRDALVRKGGGRVSGRSTATSSSYPQKKRHNGSGPSSAVAQNRCRTRARAASEQRERSPSLEYLGPVPPQSVSGKGGVANAAPPPPPPKPQEAAPADSEPVAKFLRELPQDLSSLLPVLVATGVNNKQAMSGLVRMKNWRTWLYSCVRSHEMTELQYAMVVDGLEKIEGAI